MWRRALSTPTAATFGFRRKRGAPPHLARFAARRASRRRRGRVAS